MANLRALTGTCQLVKEQTAIIDTGITYMSGVVPDFGMLGNKKVSFLCWNPY